VPHACAWTSPGLSKTRVPTLITQLDKVSLAGDGNLSAQSLQSYQLIFRA
jgi:hypothetical protein